jgi:glycosyltransferase involved in cell wall biosynthesis
MPRRVCRGGGLFFLRGRGTLPGSRAAPVPHARPGPPQAKTLGPLRPLGVVVFPRNPTNPYQRLLYDEVRALGVECSYVGAPTPSQTLNLLLLPCFLVGARLRAFRVLHIHWMYLFAPPWVRHVPFARYAMEAWALVCLQWARVVGYRLVWTAHNIVPNSQVFANDPVARRRLVRRVDAVIAHGESAVPALAALGARSVDVIPAGSYVGEYPDSIGRAEARTILGLGQGDRVVVFVGAIAPYKGVDSLLEAALGLPPELCLRIVVAGRCDDPALLGHLRSLAVASPRVLARFGHVPDEQMQVYFRGADVAVLPYRRITNSGSAILALSFGVPLLIPALPELADIPLDVAVRYEPGRTALEQALAQVATLGADVLSQLSENARRFSTSLSWAAAAAATLDVYRRVMGTPDST